MRAAAVASLPILLAMALLMVGNSFAVTLISLRAADLGFTTDMIGAMQGAYPLAALVGAMAAPALIHRFGHASVIAGLSVLAAAATLAHPLTADFMAWVGLRVIAGFCFSGLYIASESWLHARAENHYRGALLSFYFAIQTGCSALGQLLFGVVPADGATAFAVVVVLYLLAVPPVLGFLGPAPDAGTPQRMPLTRLLRIAPAATLGALANGAAQGTVYVGLGFYGVATGLDPAAVGYTIAAATVGGFLAQYPLAALSDRMDRRLVVLAVSAAGVAVALAMVMLAPTMNEPGLLLGLCALMGATALPVYSIWAAVANDRLDHGQRIPAAGALVLVMYIGLSIAPPAGSALIGHVGPSSLFLVVAAAALASLLLALPALRRRA